MIRGIFALLIAFESGGVQDSARLNVWTEGGKNVISHIHSPDGSIVIDSSVPGIVGISTAGAGNNIRMAVIRSGLMDYEGMVMECRNLTYNGFSDWRLANVEETIFVCRSGLATCQSGADYETQDLIESQESYIVPLVVRFFSSGFFITKGLSYWSDASRAFICVR